MSRPAAVAALLSVFIVAAIAMSALTPWMTPDADDFAAHSYSGHPPGYRGLYETLAALGVPVSRHTGTPAELFSGRRRVLLLEPSIWLLEREKGYLERMERWIEAGGEVLVLSRDLTLFDDPYGYRVDPAEVEEDEEGAPDAPSPFEEEERHLRQVMGPDEFRARLGARRIRVEPEEQEMSERIEESLPEFLRRRMQAPPRPDTAFDPVFTGTFSGWEAEVETLALPAYDHTWFGGEDVEKASGRIEIETEFGEYRPLVLEWARGAGRVVMVSEPILFNNLGLREGDNAVLAYRLASRDGLPVVIDEYYHGALEGLNPFALLRVHPYGAIAVSLLLATLLWAWANGVRFGAVVPHRAEARRSILEYVDAMARLFRRARKWRFVLETNRDGLLDEVRREFYLRPGTPPEAVVRRVAQTDPVRARRIESVLREAGLALASVDDTPAADLPRLQERLQACRTSKGHNPTPRTPKPERT